MKWGAAALWLLGIGATLGPCYDAFHTFSGATWYGAPQFLRTVWWCPPLFAGAALSIGLSRPGFDAVVRRSAVTAPAGREVAITMALFTFGYAASGFLPTEWPVKLALLLALFGFCLWSFDRTWAGVLGAVGAAFGGWLVEHLLTSHGLFFHRDQQLLGVAGWIPGLYALASVALGTLGALARGALTPSIGVRVAVGSGAKALRERPMKISFCAAVTASVLFVACGPDRSTALVTEHPRELDTAEAGLAETRAAGPGAGLHYIGWFASDAAEELAPLSNVSWPWFNPGWDASESAANAVRVLQDAEAQGMKVTLSIDGLFFKDGFTLRSPDEFWVNWWVFDNAIRPYQGSIALFYPMDEPGNVCANKPSSQCEALRTRLKSDLETVAYIVKQSYPSTPIGVIHTFWEMKDDLDGKRQLMNPWNFDWLAFDCYGDFGNCMGKSIPTMQARLRQRLRPGQRTFLVPDAWSHGDTEATLVYRAGQYVNLAKTDATVAMMAPFIWRHPEMQGASTMPWLAQTWRDIGRDLLKPKVSGAGRGCDDGYCLWVVGENVMPDSSIDLRLPGHQEIAASVYEVNRDTRANPQVITLRVPEALWPALDSTGLNLWVVDPRRGNWSDGTHVGPWSGR